MNQAEIEGNVSNEIMSKLLATQNVMKNKFKKAFSNRLEREHILNQSIAPLIASTKTTINDSETPEESDSLRNLAKTKNTTNQLCLATKSYSIHAIDIKSQPMSTAHDIHIYFEDPNKLCDRLRLLLSSQIVGNMEHGEEINTIIAKLRELEIIV